MTLRELVSVMDEAAVVGGAKMEVLGLGYDSRRIRPGDLFFGLSGLKQDGQAYVRQALSAGAVAAVVGRDIRLPGATLVQVDEPRKALAQASAHFFGDPSRAMTVVGVTGTNGKTTTTYLLEAIFEQAGRRAGVIGTTGARLAGEVRPLSFTTPEAPELQRLLQDMREREVEAVALELSSHALAQRRCYGLECDVAVFTNLSHDHLDYHGTLDAYLDAKLMLFDGRNGPVAKHAAAVLNADDPMSPRVAEAAARGRLRPLFYGEAPGADIRITDLAPTSEGLRFALGRGARRSEIVLPMMGRYNAWNAAAAFAAARALGIADDIAAAGLAAVRGVPGRLERVFEGQPFEVVVDYAHTPDALARALAAARDHTDGRVIVVFGCGGDRDVA